MGKNTNTRNGLIDLQRFVFALMIVFLHMKNYGETILPNGNIAVEFFFILSGYLIASKADKYKGNGLWNDNIRFTLKKILGIFPFLLISVLFGSLLYTVLFSSSGRFLNDFLLASVDFLSVQMFGFRGIVVSGVSWYLSVLFLCSFVLFPVLVKHRDVFVKYLAPVIVLFLYGYIAKIDGSLHVNGQWYGFVYSGMIRGIAAISLGTITYEVRRKIDSMEVGKLGKVGICASPIVIIVLAFVYARSSCEYDTYGFMFIPLMALLVATSFSKNNVLASSLGGRVSSFLGKFSLSIYLCHYYIASLLPALIDINGRMTILIYLGIVFVTATFNYIIGNLIINRKTRYATIIGIVILLVLVLVVV